MANRDSALPPGKLPNALLQKLLSRYVTPDPTVLVGPGIGRDAAALSVGDHVLVVKTDPITFPTPDVGRYLVHVNANDIACMGAQPRWLLVTALLPERTTTPQLVEEIFASLAAAAQSLGISLAGGHTEITLGLDRPILVGQMLGMAEPDQIINASRVAPGDAIILAGGIAIEGTSILAREAVLHLGALPNSLIERAQNLITNPGLSVLPAIRALSNAGIRPSYLHDPTEGGLATALVELGTAVLHGVEILESEIPILPETSAICNVLGLDPLGLIASGALLAVVPAADAAAALRTLRDSGILAAMIGTVTPLGTGNRLVGRPGTTQLPAFPRDEIARYFESRELPEHT